MNILLKLIKSIQLFMFELTQEYEIVFVDNIIGFK